MRPRQQRDILRSYTPEDTLQHRRLPLRAHWGLVLQVSQAWRRRAHLSEAPTLQSRSQALFSPHSGLRLVSWLDPSACEQPAAQIANSGPSFGQRSITSMSPTRRSWTSLGATMAPVGLPTYSVRTNGQGLFANWPGNSSATTFVTNLRQSSTQR